VYEAGEGEIMTGKTVKESSVIISLVTLPQDANPAGMVHGGVIMYHIDNAAGVAAMRHTRKNAVTASIDSLDFHNPVFVGDLLIIRACLNLVSKTSMEVGVRVEVENLFSGKVTHTASAYLTFVCLDENRRPMKVPPLILETDDDKKRNRQALERRRIRMMGRKKKG
jgi:acyl-CoA hydrolase